MMVRKVDSEMVFQQIKRRPRDCHKGDFGRVMLVVGSIPFPGGRLPGRIVPWPCGLYVCGCLPGRQGRFRTDSRAG